VTAAKAHRGSRTAIVFAGPEGLVRRVRQRATPFKTPRNSVTTGTRHRNARPLGATRAWLSAASCLHRGRVAQTAQCGSKADQLGGRANIRIRTISRRGALAHDRRIN
jgi:hypothetical protein